MRTCRFCGAGVQHAGALDGVLRAELRDHLVQVQAELRQALVRDLDEQLLGLRAEDLDLGDVGHAQQRRAHVVGELAQLLVAEAVGRQREDRAVDVAEVVVEHRADHALRQGAAHVADPLAHLVPDVGHLLGRRAVLQLQDGQRLAGLGVAADDVGVRHLLQRLLDLVGHLLGHLLRAGAGPERLHDHRAEGERRILVLAELEVRGEAEHHQHDHQVARQRRMLERPARDVEARRLASRRRRRAGHARSRQREATLLPFVAPAVPAAVRSA